MSVCSIACAPLQMITDRNERPASNFSRGRWRWSLKPKSDVLDSVRMQQNDWLVSYVIYVPPSRMPWMTTKKKTRNINHVRAGIVDASSLSIINDCSVNYPINNNNIITLFWFQNWIPLKLLPLVFRWVWVDGTSSSFSTRTKSQDKYLFAIITLLISRSFNSICDCIPPAKYSFTSSFSSPLCRNFSAVYNLCGKAEGGGGGILCVRVYWLQ